MTRPPVVLFALLTILALLLTGCGGDLDPTPTPVPPPASTATTAPPPPSPTASALPPTATTLPPTATTLPPTKTPAPTATTKPAVDSSASVYFMSGKAAYDAGDYEQAVAELNKALKTSPDYTQALYYRGLAYRALGQSSQAVTDLSHLINLEPKSTAAYLARALAYQDQQQGAHAMDDYEAAFGIEARDLSISASVCSFMLQVGATPDAAALASCDKGLADNPDDDQLLFYNALAHLVFEDYPTAIADFNRVIEHNPADVDAYLGRGFAYAGAGEQDLAAADLKHVTEIGDKSDATAASQLLALASTMGIAVAVAPEPVSSCAAQWHVVGTQPEIAGAHISQFWGFGVAPVASDDVWMAVITNMTSMNGKEESVFEHWDGQNWTVTPLDQPGTLYSIAAASPTELWAVGNAGDKPIIVRGDGKNWTPVDLPSVGDASLISVAAIPGQAWAVGTHKDGSPLALHWDGTSWAAQNPTGVKVGLMRSVTMLPNGQVWTAGIEVVDRTFIAMMYHWDGQAWNREPVDFSADADLRSIAALSPTTVWAVGESNGDTLVLRRNEDGRWAQVNVAKAFQGSEFELAQLIAVGGTSPSDVWIVGAGGNMKEQLVRALALHWDGQGWAIAHTDKPGSAVNQFSAIGVSPGGDVWAVGPQADDKSWSIMAQRLEGNCATP